MKIVMLMLLTFLVSCQSLQTRTVTRGQAPGKSAPTSETRQGEDGPQESFEEAPPEQPEMPKVGVILGAGGARTYAHISFLKEAQRARLPLHAIAGVEWAAPVALLYAQNQRANDVEWQMLKIKEERFLKTGLFSRQHKAAQINSLNLWQESFAKIKMDRLDLTFVCPVNNFKKNEAYVLTKGQAPSVLNYCVGYPPLFEPLQEVAAGVKEIELVAESLRQKGANYIIFVNVLGEATSMQFANASDKVLWAETASRYRRPFRGVDTVISLKAGNYGMMDFTKKREIMSQANESAKSQVQELAKKWGL